MEIKVNSTLTQKVDSVDKVNIGGSDSITRIGKDILFNGVDSDSTLYFRPRGSEVDSNQAYLDTWGNFNAKTLLANGKMQKTYCPIDASSLSSSTFYPVVFSATDNELDIEVHSPNLGGTQPYNQNAIHFLITRQGWSDTPKNFFVLSYGVFDGNEITIGCIGAGQKKGPICVWVRGGLLYRFFCNGRPTLYPSGYTSDSGEIFNPGSNYYGGTNTAIDILFTPLTTITGGAYLSGNLKVSGTVSQGSLRELKENITPFNKKAIDIINKTDIVNYNYKEDVNKTLKVGFIADDTDSILSGPKKDSMDLGNCVGVLIKAIQELDQEIQELKNKESN